MKKLVTVTGLFTILLVIAYIQYNSYSKQDPRGKLYAGSQACGSCHGNLYNSYLHTAHYSASLPATQENVRGSFAEGHNEFEVNESQKVVMEKLGKNFFQAYYVNGKAKERYRFDVVLGSVKGESYLSWKGNELYQLPLSYFNANHKWSTSPGYRFDISKHPDLRNIRKRCLECHASYIDNIPDASPQSPSGEQFDKSSLVYSIDCERCHGPGQKHVDFHTYNPLVKTAKYITSYNTLNRSQKIDMCAVCHSGNSNVMLKSTFEFKPGDTYAKFKMPEFYQKIDTSQLDVHGSQVQLLEGSKCFINSNMDCTTCHDTHQNSRGDNNLFASKCLNCHNSINHTDCKMTKQLSAAALKANCVGCHMPALPSKFISVQVSDKMPSIRFNVHTHYIATYPQEVKKILNYIEN